VGVREIERITVERTMNRDGERRSQAIFLLRSGARLPATPLDDHDKTALVTSFAAVQAGEQPSFVEWYAGLAGYASPVVGALGAMLLAFAGRAMRKARALTSSK
jgi:hypothetical protein